MNLPREEENTFIKQWKHIATVVHNVAKSKGWWSGNRNDGELLMLIVSELSEALEGLRHNNPPSEHIKEFSAAEEELADVVIRVMDMAKARNWRVGEAIMAKIQFNSGREYMHDGKKF